MKWSSCVQQGLLLQQLRQPISFIWTIALPTTLYFTFQYQKDDVAFLGSYIVFSIYIYGGALYIIAHRESGFLKCLIPSRRSLLHFSVALYIANTLIALTGISIFYLLLYCINEEVLITQFLQLMFLSPALYLISLNVLHFRKALSEMHTVINISMMLFIITPFLHQPIAQVFNYLNPIYLHRLFFSSSEYSVHWVTTLLMTSLGIIALLRLDRQPVEGRA